MTSFPGFPGLSAGAGHAGRAPAAPGCALRVMAMSVGRPCMSLEVSAAHGAGPWVGSQVSAWAWALV